MGSHNISITYQTIGSDRPFSAVRVRAAAGDIRRGWLTAGGQSIPVELFYSSQIGEAGTDALDPAGVIKFCSLLDHK